MVAGLYLLCEHRLTYTDPCHWCRFELSRVALCYAALSHTTSDNTGTSDHPIQVRGVTSMQCTISALRLCVSADMATDYYRMGDIRIYHIILSSPPKEACPVFLIEGLGVWLGAFCLLGRLSWWDWWFSCRLIKSFYSRNGLVEWHN